MDLFSIDEIVLNEDIYKDYLTNNEYNILKNIDKINLITGVNNAGKSRFLRNLFIHIDNTTKVNRNKRLEFAAFFANQILHTITNTLNNINTYYVDSNFNQISYLKSKVNDITKASYCNLETLLEFTDLILDKSNSIKDRHPEESNELIEVHNLLLDHIKNDFINISKNNNKILSVLYIPILRGLRPIHFNGNDDNKKFSYEIDVYTERTEYDYRIPSSKKYDIYSGHTIFKDIMQLLLGDEYDRKLMYEFENYLSETIFGTKITIIPRYEDDVLHIKIGDDKQLEIFNLGDGLQTIITILFPIFKLKDKQAWIFIEEPETHLHPTWQRKLFNAIIDISPNHQYFISTHSNVFMNMEGANIFECSKMEDKFKITNVKLEEDKLAVLSRLGYQASDVLLSNYILWVEGYSDKIYFKYWLSQKAPELKEGVHYSIMYYGGDNLSALKNESNQIDLSLLTNIGKSMGIFLDSDKKNETDTISEFKIKIRNKFENSGRFCWLTEKRMIENYIPKNIFEQVVRDYYNKPYITIDEGDFIDRTKIPDENMPVEYKARIKLSQNIMTIVQQQGNINSLSESELKQGINEAILATGKQEFKIKKIEIAKKVASSEHDLMDTELNTKLDDLIVKIKESNGLDV